eukprot:gnl/TRDRNA2_/TRDRNA2_68614_c1_seq1.p1 gnl/TRDRNA2_/TRDRNA2_68614_c1~~gnl/TRDRNA2_/TRDRNA2_68614_c1_seq1.p1  ORF type:complete len:131 (+),score=13.71 gnl/TRDRNA2_/TRDRNA2_68614_c1_seq1:90-482(+)
MQIVHRNDEGKQDRIGKMIENGLLRKRRAAEIALAMTKDNHNQTREELSRLAGNQGRYSLLDADGCMRAREIASLRVSLRRSHKHGESIANTQFRLNQLLQYHAEQKLVTKIARRRTDSRLLLKGGASFS